MKTLDANMLAQLASSVSTLTTCVRILRKDGQEFLFTSFDKDLVVGGKTYKATSSYEPTAINTNTKLSSDNFDIMGIVSSDEVTETDLLKGLFDDAEVWFFVVDYTNPDAGQNDLTYGNIGEIKHSENSFTAEFRSLSAKLQQNIGDVYSRSCRAELGDTKCGVKLAPNVWVPGTAYVIGDEVSPISFSNKSFICSTAGTSNYATSTITLASGSATGTDSALLADATTYYTTINSVNYSITGAAADDVDAVITKLNTALSGVATVSLVGGNIVITNDLAGSITTIEYTTNTSDVFYVMGGSASATIVDSINEPTWDNTVGNTTTETSGVAWTTQTSFRSTGTVQLIEGTDILITNFRISFSALNGTNLGLDAINLKDSDDNLIVSVDDIYSCNRSVITGTLDYLFDNTINTVSITGTTNIVIDYEFTNAMPFSSYEIIKAAAGTEFPTAWTLEISMDNGQNYYTIDTRSGVTDWTGNSNSYTDLTGYGNIPGGTDLGIRTYFLIDTTVIDSPDGFYDYGVVEWVSGDNSGTKNDITKYAFATGRVDLFLQTPFNIKAGDSFNLFTGCNHLLLGTDGTTTTGDCKTKFNNVINFRGEPYIPTEDKLMDVDTKTSE